MGDQYELKRKRSQTSKSSLTSMGRRKSLKRESSIRCDSLTDVLARVPKQYENTYRMEPIKKFPHDATVKIVTETLEKHLKGEQYQPEFAGQMCLSLSEVIKQRVKELNVERYRIIVVVHIGQKRAEARVASRCLWHDKYDTSATGSFKNDSLFAVGIVYGIYYE